MEEYLVELSKELVNQQKSRVIVEANEGATGFWFGAGNIVESTEEEEGKKRTKLWLTGRYRNFGDSRKGLEEGERGISIALFSSSDMGVTWSPQLRWDKHQLAPYLNRKILSIEGSCLYFNKTTKKWELFISSEKEREYPAEIREYRKEGTGVWSIDVIESDTNSIRTLNPSTIREVIASNSPEILHVKDPYVFADDDEGAQKRVTKMIICTHPYNWSSSNCALAIRENEGDVCNFKITNEQFVERGKCWDVAVCRLTSKFSIPQLLIEKIKSIIQSKNAQKKAERGEEDELSDYTFYYYDGAECVRALDQNIGGVKRARGHSCEELGGLFLQRNKGHLKRISALYPLYLSPYGSSSCRYISSYAVADGIITIWQQSQPSFAQHLVSTYHSFDSLFSFIESLQL